MPSIKAASIAQLERDKLAEFTMGDDSVAICRVNGEIHALDGKCSHRGGPLAQGALHGKMLVCPWHAWEFDCTTGQNDYNPDIRLRKFAVTVDNGDILIEIP